MEAKDLVMYYFGTCAIFVAMFVLYVLLRFGIPELFKKVTKRPK